MTVLKDQLGRVVNLPEKPLRIVSLVPSQTELLIALGLEKNLVGITKFCVHPKHLISIKRVVGGTKNLNYTKIAALKPTIILCNKEENTKEIVATLEKNYPVHVSDVMNLSDAYALIVAYGKMFSCQEKAAAIIHKIKEENVAFTKEISPLRLRKVLYMIWQKPWMAAGKDTFIDAMLQLNGYQNCITTAARYPELSNAAIRKLNPDCVFLSSEPFPFAEKHCASLQEILPQAKIKLVDGEFFSWYGSRLIDAFRYFKTLHA